MRKIFLFCLSLAISFSFAQEPEKQIQTTTTTTVVTTKPIEIEVKKPTPITKKNEIRVDPFYLIFAGALNASYERVLDEESGAGVNLLLSNGKDINTTFSVSPYYRIYFGKKTAAGFFFEGFAQYSSKKLDKIIDFNNNGSLFFNNYQYKTVTVNDLALGLGLGGKWISRKGIIFELSLGIGRNLLNDYSNIENSVVAGKGGISIGKRF